MEIGIQNQLKETVFEGESAKNIGSGELDVLATPCLIAIIEKACWQLVSPYLEQGQSTVGSKVDLLHLYPTAIGKEITVDVELIDIDRRRLTFKIEAHDDKNKIAEGQHERFIIDKEKFIAKTNW